jgi:maltose O-acetyltransferase
MKTEKEKMLEGALYDAADSELAAERLRVKKLLHRLNVSEYDAEHGAPYHAVRRELLPNCAEDVYIEQPFYCDYGYNIFCKEKVYFNHNVVILDINPVRIGSNVLFGPNVQIYSATHPTDHKIRREWLELGAPITIGDDCWIGGGSIICPGVTIGDRCVIGAGSVVTKDIPAGSLAVGNPARVIKKLD